MDQAELVREFSSALSHGRGHLFVGAGLSVPAGVPRWTEVLESSRAGLGIPRAFDDMPLLAQYLEDHDPGGRALLERSVREAVGRATSPTTVHHLINELPRCEVWTTNFDDLLEQVMPEASVWKDDRRPVQAVDGRVVIKMHGELASTSPKSGASPSGIVISRRDFDAYPDTHPTMWARLVAMFATQSILFLGFSFSDPNSAHLLRLARTQFRDTSVAHYAVIRRPTDPDALALHPFRIRDLQTSGVHALEVDEHGQLDGVLRDLVVASRGRRVQVSGSWMGDDVAMERLAEGVGSILVRLHLQMISGASKPAHAVANVFGEWQHGHGTYDPDDVTLYSAATSRPPIALRRRIGTHVYYGAGGAQMRARILRRARANIVIGGADGTRREVELARHAGLPVIPLGCSGGTARAVWSSMRADLSAHAYGGRPIDPASFDALSSDTHAIALGAVELLLRQALFLD